MNFCLPCWSSWAKVREFHLVWIVASLCLKQSYLSVNSDVTHTTQWMERLILLLLLVIAIPGFGIEKFVIPGSRFGIRLLDWPSLWYPQLTYFMHRMLYGLYGRYVQNVGSEDDCQNTNYSTQHGVVLWRLYNILFIRPLKFLFLSFDM